VLGRAAFQETDAGRGFLGRGRRCGPYVAGGTDSASFPGVGGGSIQPANGGQSDGFVAKINAGGSALVYSTFLGGSGQDAAFAIAIDAAGDALVTGGTTSTTFPGVGPGSIQPVNAGMGDAFVTAIDAAGGAILYSTFLGGGGGDEGLAIAVDRSGSAYVTGQTTSTALPGIGAGSVQPANAGGADAFVAKLDPAGTAVVYSTFLGGGGFDRGQGVAVDGAGDAYVTGYTSSTSFPGVIGSSIQPASGGQLDAFVTVIDGAGSGILWSTFLGGAGSDAGFGIAVDADGNAYVAGQTGSAAFPGVGAGSIQPANAGRDDAFVTKIAVTAPGVGVGVPTLSRGGLMLMALLLAAAGLAGARRARRPRKLPRPDP
jgi:hypothetical protein